MTFMNRSSKFSSSLIFGGICVILMFTGCSSKMTKSDCEAKDFYKMGVKDGEHGKDVSKFQEQQNQCRDAGVTVTDEKYGYGRKVGLTDYCTPSRGESDGAKGKPSDICMKEQVPPYMTAYSSALDKAKNKTERDLKDVEKKQSALQQRQDQLKGRVDSLDSQQKANPETH